MDVNETESLQDKHLHCVMAITITIPGWRALNLAHLVLDYNGTLARDGRPLVGVESRLQELAQQLEIHVLTADTFGRAQAELAGFQCKLIVLQPGNEHSQKADYIERLGPEVTAAIGNGRNDREMLARAALAIAVLGAEGLAAETLAAADIVVPDPVSALDLLLHPQRIVATLRS